MGMHALFDSVLQPQPAQPDFNGADRILSIWNRIHLQSIELFRYLAYHLTIEANAQSL